jgi:hypothetical protein
MKHTDLVRALQKRTINKELPAPKPPSGVRRNPKTWVGGLGEEKPIRRGRGYQGE